MFSEKSFNFRLILTVVYILSADFTPFTLLYFTKEIGRLVTLEREIKQVKMDENYTLMANSKGRWQNLKEKLKSGSMKIDKKRKHKQHIHAKNRTGQK
ncbi:hypothetical protein [Prevotella marseillensis]|uniref:hypothetical protein n=1 Tax=Prevotella marseillensis TaxID=2479840 RepID=UPI000F6345E0|nr:hypothetical protein [Prevotella marseillensis]